MNYEKVILSTDCDAGAQLNGKWRIKNECYLILNSQFSI